MITIYNFKRLINKYSKYNSIIYFDVVDSKIDMTQGGKRVDVIEEKEVKGAIVSKKETIRHDSGGFSTIDSTMFYSYDFIKDGSKIKVNDDKVYMVNLSKDYSKFDTCKDGLRIYKLEGGSNE